jgi:hypothetical protein
LQENQNNLKAKIEPNYPQPVATSTPATVNAAPAAPDFTTFKATAKPESLLSRFKAAWPPTKKQALLVAGILVLIISGVGAVLALTQKSGPVVVTKPVVRVKKVPAPVVPTTVASNLSGLQIEPTLNTKPVVGVMVENSLAARPQSGLSQAGVVYEAIAEGGITRFLALFQETNPTEIGPIRSVRPYYLQWAMGFDASIAHVGGSPEALGNIRDWATRDLDQFSNSGAYTRVGSKSAPHNVYSSLDTFTQLAQAKGYGTSTFAPWLRKKESASPQVTSRSIDMVISGPQYNIHYDYDAASNSYKRSMAGAPHVDALGGAQISPKNVIGLVTSFAIQADGKHSQYGTLGSGQAYIFQDGLLTIGQWNKPDIKSAMTFTDAAGQPLPLNPGQTWLTAVSNPAKITSAP